MKRLELPLISLYFASYESDFHVLCFYLVLSHSSPVSVTFIQSFFYLDLAAFSINFSADLTIFRGMCFAPTK